MTMNGFSRHWLLLVPLAAACSGSATQYARSPLRPAPAAERGGQGKRAETLDDAPAWDANSVMRELGKLAQSVRSTRYAHEMVVNEETGYYQFDCSDMASWVLSRATPVAYATLQAGATHRPLAKDYHRTIAAIPAGQRRGGWYRVASVIETKPGDVVAWLRPRDVDSRNTGHVAFVAAKPARLKDYENAFLIRVVDASASTHGDDTRSADGPGGFGIGTIALATTQFGEPTHYSWAAHLDRFLSSTIVIGRALR